MTALVVRWLAKVAAWSFTLFLLIGLPLLVYLDGVGAGCTSDPEYDPHCTQAIPSHDWFATALTGGIFWIGGVAAGIDWLRKRSRPRRDVDSAS